MSSTERGAGRLLGPGDLIAARRSIRRGFDGRPVPRATIEAVLDAALDAPSSKNAQPWRFHVVEERATLVEIADEMERADDGSYVPIDPSTGAPRPEYASSVAESAAVLRAVSLALFIENDGAFSGGRETLLAHPGSAAESLIGYTFEVIGIGAAVENAWLAAQTLGLVGVFIGDVLIVEAGIRNRLAIVGDLVGVLALGYSDAAPHAQRAVAAERVRWHESNQGT